ncbi:MAG TPA: vitamin K epoxide reductase family protein [Vicinamibacterales bacterium]|nr:vitamin K epoxide reductase family protein [Vicinamibacterales bacterium]
MTTPDHVKAAPEAAPPWDYNPSSWSQRIPICLLAMVGFFISAYMALYQWRLIDSVWDPFFGEQTQRVLDSNVSHRMQRWFGVPDAALGAVAYLGDAVLGLAGSTRRWQYRPWLVVLFGIDVIPLGGVSAILVIIQATVLGEWCFLCLVTAAISLILVYWAYDEVWSSLLYLRRVWQRSRRIGVVWTVFWGGYHADGEAVAGGR